MRKIHKVICKNMVHDAMQAYRNYDKYHKACNAEKSLILYTVESIMDYMPINDYDKHSMRDYVTRMLERLMG